MRPGNVGVWTIEDSADLYAIRFVNENDLMKIERLKDGWTKWIFKNDFWVLLDNL